MLIEFASADADPVVDDMQTQIAAGYVSEERDRQSPIPADLPASASPPPASGLGEP